MSFAMPRLVGATRLLLFANLGLFLASFVLYLVAEGAKEQLYRVFALEPRLWVEWAPLVPLWQALSYSFLHSVDDPWHVLLNMLLLFFAGSLLESQIGARRFLLCYLCCALAGGLCFLAVGLMLGGSDHVVGASGAVLGVLIAAAVLRPEAEVYLFPLPMPIRLRILAIGIVALQLIFAALALKKGGDGTAYSAHFGGLAAGFALAKSGLIWRDPIESWKLQSLARQASDLSSDEERLDVLLARISREGIGSLSERERDFLKRVSKRHQAR